MKSNGLVLVGLVLAILVVGNSSQALVSKIRPEQKIELVDGKAFEVCWLGEYSEATKILIAETESYLQSEMNRAGFEIIFYPNCFSLPSPYKPIGIAFYDDPELRESVKNDIRSRSGFMSKPGHPVTFAQGKSTTKSLIDINLTSRFGDVNASLENQIKSLSDQGKFNLIMTIAAHEFMHAIGFAHEQDHGNSTCTTGRDRFSGGFRDITEYDPQSILNYCLTHVYDYNVSKLGLSPLDISGLRIEY